MRLYDFHESGNGFKVRVLLAALGLAHERIELDILKGETRTPEFLVLNPNGRIPLLVLDDGRTLAESNAILYYLAQGTPYWPQDAYARAKVLEWMNFEQYSHEPYVAVVRFWTFSGQLEDHAAELPEKRRRADEALDVMEQHLGGRDYFVDDRYSIADIALYAYTHVAHEGGFDLGTRPAVAEWVRRIAERPEMIRIDDARP